MTTDSDDAARAPEGAHDAPKDGAPTAGQRLAAARAAKAAAKAASRGGAVSAGDVAVDKATADATHWLETHGRWLGIVLASGVAVGIAAVAWNSFATSSSAAAGASLHTAIETSTAPIRAAEATPEESDDVPARESFTSVELRAKKALELHRKVGAAHGGSRAAAWARLGEATALLDLGRVGDARAAYQRALNESDGDDIIAWRALEGIGFSYESEQKWRDAVSQYDRLAAVANGAYRDFADYHLARMLLVQGRRDDAKNKLKTLVERLRGRDETEGSRHPFLLTQAEIRLSELDPNAVPRRSAPAMDGMQLLGGGGGVDSIPPEQLQEILRRLQESQGAGGGPPGAPVPSP